MEGYIQNRTNEAHPFFASYDGYHYIYTNIAEIVHLKVNINCQHWRQTLLDQSKE